MTKPTRKHLLDDEYEKLKTYLNDASHTDVRVTLFALLSYSGMRQSELCELDGDSLDHKTKSIFVKSKKGTANRSIVLNEILYQRLVPIFNEMSTRKARAGDYFSESARNAKAQTRMVRYFWVELSQKIFGEYVVTLHGLRHCFAKRVLEATGNDLLKTQKLMGHVNLNSTAIYCSYYDTLDLAKFVLRAND